MDLLQQIVARAKADKQRIVLPEAEEERTLKAADKVLADDIADIILIGNPANIHKLAKEWGLENIDKATIVNPSDNPLPSTTPTVGSTSRFRKIPSTDISP